MGATWYYAWYIYNRFRTDATPSQTNLEYVPMAKTKGSNSDGSYTAEEILTIKQFASANPGKYWLIWNEPDFYNSRDPYNSYIPVSIAARIYKQLREGIKSADPTAKMIIGGMLYQDHWIDWARTFRDTYHSLYGSYPEYEGWHGHIYVCGSSYNRDNWRNSIINFRSWINGTTGGEFWLTEFGCLNYDYDQIIRDQLDWMENYNGLQRYAWFSASSIEWGSSFQGGNLFLGKPENSDFRLNGIGVTYSNYPLSTNPTPTVPNPTATRTPATPTLTPSPTTPSPTPTHSLGTPTPTIPNPPPTPTRHPGDANSDGKVDGADYVIWLNHLNLPNPNGPNEGDFNSDGKVDGADYVIWLNNFQNS